MMVSLFPHIKATTGGHACAITAVLDGIRAGKWRREVEAVRAEPAGSQAYDQAKRCLPYFTPSGTFERRSIAGLVEHSGLMSLDLDSKQNPDTNWGLVRVSIQADPSTYACFLSTGGNGLCVLVPVPTTHHKASFRALERYYLDSFGLKVDSLPDVSRARFISYDPDLFLNTQAETFAELLEEAPKLTATPPPAAAPRPSGETYGAAALRRAVEKVLGATEGHKHATLNKMAFLCGGYVASGFLDEGTARQQLQDAIGQRDVNDAKQALQTIEDGLRDGQSKPVLPPDLQFQPRQELRASGGNPGVAVALAHRLAATHGVPMAGVTAAIDLILEEQALNPTLLTFWSVLDPGKDKPLKAVIDLDKFGAWLTAHGFRKYRPVAGSYATVRAVDNLVEHVDRGQLVDFVRDYMESLPEEFDGLYGKQVHNQVWAMERKLFDPNFLLLLPTLPDHWLTDTAESAFFFFRNCWATVTADGIAARPYGQLPALIWSDQRRAHDFQVLPALEVNACHFHQFTKNITAGDAERLALLRVSLGYLLHGYKEEVNTKCIIFLDEVATTGKPDGRTGKSLLLKAVGQLVNVTLIPGATFRFEDAFRFSRIDASTRIAYFDEWDGRRLPFKKLFTEVTTDMAVNRKNQAEFVIPFAHSPKFAITTNDIVSGEGGSNNARRIEIPLAPHYSAGFTPVMEFGSEFFSPTWGDDWNYFFNLALGWVHEFLTGGRRLQQLASAAIDARKLEDSTSPEFLEFIAEVKRVGSGDFMDPIMWADTLYQQFLAYSGEAQHRFPMRRFYQWMQKVGFSRKQWKKRDMSENKSFFELPEDVIGLESAAV